MRVSSLVPGLITAALFSSGASGVEVRFLRDINPASDATPGTEIPELEASGGRLYYVAWTSATGRELWRSTGSLGQVIEVYPGTENSNPRELTDVAGTLFFVVSPSPAGQWSGAAGRDELWRTDGTAAGTVMILQLTSAGSPVIRSLAAAGATLFFVGCDAATGCELWKSDGTPTGTGLVRDIVAGPETSWPVGLAGSGARVFFWASMWETGTELWQSDGTASGTTMVADLVPAGGAGSSPLVTIGGLAYFDLSPNAPGVWRSDGTAAGTFALVTDALSGAGFTPLANGTVLFQAHLPDPGGSTATLWATDGTVAGTRLVKDLGVALFPDGFTALGSRVLFVANDGVHGEELWASDGTTEGTALVADLMPGAVSSSPWIIGAIEDTAYFAFSSTSTAVPALWRSDGTTAGTVGVKAWISRDAGGTPGVAQHGYLFFPGCTPADGCELLRTDGTASGTVPITDARRSQGIELAGAIVDSSGALVFRADDGVHGSELWRSDGTAEGTRLVKDVYPGAAGSYPHGPGALARMDGRVLFNADDGIHGKELWATDGSEAGTSLVSDHVPGATGSLPAAPGPAASAFGVLGGRLYYSAAAPSGYEELTRSDGTSEGTALFLDLPPSTHSSLPFGFRTDAGRLAFFGATGSTGGLCSFIYGALFLSDGTEAGTAALTGKGAFRWGHCHGGRNYDPPGRLTPSGGLFYFAAPALWRTDGTVAGTFQLGTLDSYYVSMGSVPTSLADLDGTLMFTGWDRDRGYELWHSDGSPTGTQPVKDVRPGPVSSVPSLLTAVGRRVYFAADDGVLGRELWASDGTAEGTVLVKDIEPGGAGSAPRLLTNVEGTLYFVASDRESGMQLWRSDGTAQGTVRLTALLPGSGADIQGLWLGAAGLFLSVVEPTAGDSLWLLPLAPRGRHDAGGDRTEDALLRDAGGAVHVLASEPEHGRLWSAQWSGGFVPYRYDVFLADATGDGRADLVSRSLDTGAIEVFRSSGRSFDYLAGSGPGGAWTSGFDPAIYDLLFADVTGDGRADLVTRVKAVGDGWPVGDVWVFPSTGQGFASPQEPWSYGWSDGYDLYLADMNGDGRADLAGRYGGPTAGLTGDVYVALSTGSRFASPARWTYGYSAGYELQFADVTGDRRADLMARYAGPEPDLAGGVYVMPSSGTAFGWADGGRWSYGWGGSYELLLRDVTGDGRSDLLGRSTLTGEVHVAPSFGTGFRYDSAWATGVSVPLRPDAPMGLPVGPEGRPSVAGARSTPP